MTVYGQRMLLPFLLGVLLLAGPAALRGQEAPAGGNGGAVFSPGQQLTLEACVRIALDTNPIQRAAAEGIRVQEEGVGLARSAYYPQLDFSSGYQRFDSHVFLPSGVSALAESDTLGARDDWQAALSARYTLYDSGRRRAELEAALAEEGVSREEAVMIRQDLVLNVHEAYYSLLAARAEAAARRQSLERRDEHLRLVGIRADAGDVPESDIIRARVEVANARLQSVRAENTIRTAGAALNAAMGLPVNRMIDISAGGIPRGILPEELELGAAIDQALKQRAALKKSRLQLLAASRQIEAVNGAYGPKLQAEAYYGRRDEDFLPEDEEWAAGLSLSIPLFTGFARQHEVSQARAREAEIDAKLAHLHLSVQEEVADAYFRLIGAFEEVQATEVLEKDARESLRQTSRRYETGAATINDLLDVEAALAQAESDHVRAVYNHHIATSRLQRVVGSI